LADTLSELGADTSSSINLQPDGTFPAHVANPEDPAAIAATRKAVLATGADVGICLDTDADRVGLVEKSGRLLNRNGLVALVSKIALKEYEQKCIGEEGSDMKKGVVVTDSATSTGLTDYVQNVLNGDHVRYKKGYRYVIEHAKSIPNSLVAVECSGHSAWADNNWVDDGSYTAVKLIAELCNMRRELKSYELANMVSYSRSHMLTFSDLLEGLIEPAESVELRMRMAGGKAVIEAMTAKSVEEFGSVVGASPGWKVEPVNYEGLRANFEIIDENYVADSCNGVASNEGNTDILTGWTMIRVSLHEPIVSLQIESNQVGGVMHAARCLLGSEGSGIGLHTLEGELDLSPLLKAANISCPS
jgi:phosphomannomutase